MYYVFSIADNEVVGPYSLIDLIDFIQPGILVCDEQNEIWEYAENVPEIEEVLIELEIFKKTNESLPEGFLINSSGEILRKYIDRPASRRPNYLESAQEWLKNDNTKRYSKWVVFLILVTIVVIIINN